MKMPNFSEMHELRCPDCGKPLVVTLAEHNKAVFEGCRCGREVYDVPDCILFGPSGGPLSLYVPRQN